jgi:hypothetical protein
MCSMSSCIGQACRAIRLGCRRPNKLLYLLQYIKALLFSQFGKKFLTPTRHRIYSCSYTVLPTWTESHMRGALMAQKGLVAYEDLTTSFRGSEYFSTSLIYILGV